MVSTQPGCTPALPGADSPEARAAPLSLPPRVREGSLLSWQPRKDLAWEEVDLQGHLAACLGGQAEAVGVLQAALSDPYYEGQEVQGSLRKAGN
ncbi:hypothetical protein P7K49_006032 [Saguinus oedipus]|uniref:Uncharacterized protein n=1 Tax=Saguinus oedipus TaxID=9490 RepID=A0ABQ9W199_SAGOE|nr:hypothetical protein P7K49_006032 [Saguinus oedipus]